VLTAAPGSDAADVAIAVYSRRPVAAIDRAGRLALCTARWSIGREGPSSRGCHRRELIDFQCPRVWTLL